MKCFYHNDPDGFCSAYWVRKYCERENIEFVESDFIEMNYDKEFPWDTLTPGEQIFMVDFSLNDSMNMALLDRDYQFTWIDHHKTAIDKMGYDCKIKGIRRDGIAACALTWIWYTYGEIKEETIKSGLPRFENIIYDAPLFTQYIHLWDTWKWKNCEGPEHIEAFITALSACNTNPIGYNSIWYLLDVMENLFNDLVKEGHHMISFRNGYANTCCDSIGKLIDFEGYRCFACNMPKCNSEWFISVDPSTYDILMPFYYNMQTGQFSVSLYSSEVDVSKIAVKYGGGGHFLASGFQCKSLPF